MNARDQYLRKIRSEYLKTSKKEKGVLLDEAEKRTGLNRKYLLDKLKPLSNLDTMPEFRKKRASYYTKEVVAALVTCWHIFDRPCGQRLKPLLRDEVARLRRDNELKCSDEVAFKLTQVSMRTIDTKLHHQKSVERDQLKYFRKDSINPLLYHKVPVKVFSEQDRESLGNIQLDLVEHCGSSAAGEYGYTLMTTDIATGWSEQVAVLGKAQERIHKAVATARSRYPFPWREIHTDNGKEFLNDQLYRYTQKEKLNFSRSRPYKKNDNALVEQKNWTHVRRSVGYLRYDTPLEIHLLNELYMGEYPAYKNFFQPIMKLKSKERMGAKQHRKYNEAKTPYQRVMESKNVTKEKKEELRFIYDSLNPAALKRVIDKKLKMILKAYQQKNQSQTVDKNKKTNPISVRNYIAQQEKKKEVLVR